VIYGQDAASFMHYNFAGQQNALRPLSEEASADGGGCRPCLTLKEIAARLA